MLTSFLEDSHRVEESIGRTPPWIEKPWEEVTKLLILATTIVIHTQVNLETGLLSQMHSDRVAA